MTSHIDFWLKAEARRIIESTVARAVAEEREACAKVAEVEAGRDVGDWTDQNAAKGRHFAGRAIADAIRERGK